MGGSDGRDAAAIIRTLEKKQPRLTGGAENGFLVYL